MRRLNLVAILFCSVFLLSGCDWVRGQLGMPTSADLKVARQKSLLAASQKAAEDSAKMKIADSLALLQDSLKTDSLKTDSSNVKVNVNAPVVAQQGRYHVILGSFKESSNSVKMVRLLTKHGYKPILISLKSGYTLVSAASFNSERAAYNEMSKILEEDYAPDDIWIYDTNQKLHNKIN